MKETILIGMAKNFSANIFILFEMLYFWLLSRRQSRFQKRPNGQLGYFNDNLRGTRYFIKMKKIKHLQVSQELIRQPSTFIINIERLLSMKETILIGRAKNFSANIFILFERPYFWLLSRRQSRFQKRLNGQLGYFYDML